MLQRTQLMLDRQLKQDLLFLSQVKSQSMSELVRKFVSEKVEDKTLTEFKLISYP